MAKAKKAVAKRNSTELSDPLPDWMKKYEGEGQDDISRDDILMPRLKLAQSMSLEVKDKKAEEGDFIHNITGEILCKAGDTINIIAVAYAKEFILWYDRKGPKDGIAARAKKVIENGQVRYKWDKPNTEFEDSVGGNVKVKYKTKRYIDEDGLGDWGTQIPGNPDSPPAATAHNNYVVILPDNDNQMVALSLARTADRKAREFNTMLKMGSAPTYARIYKLGSFIDQSGDNRFANYQFIGFDIVMDEVFFNSLREMHESLRSKGINVDYSDEPSGDETQGSDGRF